MFFKKILYYLDIRTLFREKKSPNPNVRFMNGMNRISIYLFLFAIVVLTVRYLKG